MTFNPNGRLNLPPVMNLSTIEFLLDSGEDILRIAARLGVQPNTLEKALQRSGRADLLAKAARGRGM